MHTVCFSFQLFNYHSLLPPLPLPPLPLSPLLLLPSPWSSSPVPLQAQLRDADAALRQCGKQLEDQGRRLEEAQRGRREAEATVQHLQPLLQQREGEIQVCLCVEKGRRRGGRLDGEGC